MNRKPKHFFDKIVGDTGERILDKVRKQIGPVAVHCNSEGYAVEIYPAPAIHYANFLGNAKSLRAALMIALKKWRQVEENAE